jgi:hypothetical protein
MWCRFVHTKSTDVGLPNPGGEGGEKTKGKVNTLIYIVLFTSVVQQSLEMLE